MTVEQHLRAGSIRLLADDEPLDPSGLGGERKDALDLLLARLPRVLRVTGEGLDDALHNPALAQQLVGLVVDADAYAGIKSHILADPSLLDDVYDGLVRQRCLPGLGAFDHAWSSLMSDRISGLYGYPGGIHPPKDEEQFREHLVHNAAIAMVGKNARQIERYFAYARRRSEHDALRATFGRLVGV